MRLLSKVGALFSALLTMQFLAGPAMAAFSSPTAQNFTGLLGDNTEGAESGVFELQSTIETAGLAIVLLTLTMVGIVFARKVVRKFTG